MWVICRYVYCKIFFPTLWFAFLLSRLCLKKVKLLILMWCNLFILFLNVWKCPFWETLQVQIPEEIFLCFLLKDLLCFLYIHILKFPKVDFVVLWGRDHSFFFSVWIFNVSNTTYWKHNSFPTAQQHHL